MDIDAELALLLEEQEKFMQSGRSASAKLHTKSAKKVADPSPNQAPIIGAPSVVRPVVMERSTPLRTQPMATIQQTAGGFPAPKKTSLFGRRRQKQTSTTTTTSEMKSNPNIPHDIQADNSDAISKMSIDEIRKAQEEIQASLPADIIEMFRKRGNKTASSDNVQGTNLKPNATKIQPGIAIEAYRQNLQAPTDERTLRDAVTKLPEEEQLKHEWMTEIPTAIPSTSASRLDFDGNIIQATAESVPLHSGLYHHGLEPEMAGYSIDELMMLARSTVASQRAMALSVLAKTLRRQTAKPTTAMALVARSACEDSNQSVLQCGVDALHACLIQFSLTDQINGSIFMTPVNAQGEPHVVQYIDVDEISDVKEIEDPIQALLITQFPNRIWHLLATLPTSAPHNHTHLQLLDLAVVLAMHSRRAAAQLLETTSVHSLVNSFLSVESIDSLLRGQETVAKTLLFILRCCQADKAHAISFIDNQVIASTKVFLAMRHKALLPLQMLSMRIWRVCLSYQLDLNSVAYLFPLLCGYSAQSLTQSIDTVPLEPWPVVMQECILDAMVYLIAPETVGFLPFFLKQASQLGASNIHALRFMVATYPLIFQYPLMEIEPYLTLWPSLRLDPIQNPELVDQTLQLYAAVAKSPHSSLPLNMADCIDFLKQYVPTIQGSTDVATIASILNFVHLHDKARDSELWVRAAAYPLIERCTIGQQHVMKMLLRSIFRDRPSLVAIFEALLCTASATSYQSCHTLLPELDGKTNQPPTGSWIFTLASRFHSTESNEESTAVLCDLLSFLADVESMQPSMLAHITASDKLIHLSHLYLWEAESWRDAPTQLHSLLNMYINATDVSTLVSSTESIAALQQQSVASFLSSLTVVFCNTSYGDHGLAWVLTAFLQPSIPHDIRLALWNEIAQFQCLHLLVTISDLFHPFVTDDGLLDSFLQSILREQLSFEKGNTMYRMVLNHIGHFCFTGSFESTRKHSMLLQIFQTGNSKLVQDILSNESNETTHSMLKHLQNIPAFQPYHDIINQFTS